MKEKMAKFMAGRYGIDALSKFIAYFAVALMLIGLLFRSNILNVLTVLLLFLAYFRIFSRNIQKRYQENIKYWNLRNRCLNFFKFRKTSHIYKCPGCKQKIRIPRGKGKIEITCPKCKTQFIKRS